MAEQLASLQTVDKREDGGFISNPFTRVLHIQPSREKSLGGLAVGSSAPLEVTNVMGSLVSPLKVFGERSLHIKLGLDGVFRQVVDPLPRSARKHQGQIADSNIGRSPGELHCVEGIL
jgi:hypothetical protein